MRNIFRKLRGILTPKDRRRFIWVFVAILFMGLFEVVGIASIFPFMQLVAQPEAIEENRWVGGIYKSLGFQNDRAFLMMMGGVVLGLLAMSNGLIVLTRWIQAKAVWQSIHSLANRLLEIYLYQPYEFFLSRNSADLSKQVLDEVNQLANSVLIPAIRIVARLFVATVILGLLIVVDPMLAGIVIVVLGAVYSILYITLRGYLKDLGVKRFSANRSRFRTASEAFGGIKAIKIRGKESYFVDRFEKASLSYTRVQPKFSVASIAPVYVVQTLAFGGILSVVLYLLAVEQGVEAVLPMLSLYALAGFRLMPSLQQIYTGIATIRFNLPVIDGISKDLKMVETSSRSVISKRIGQLTFEKNIEVKDLSFKYRNAHENVLNRITVSIPKNASVAFVGPTGCGKTTLVDNFVGLLRAQKGSVLVDGVEITEQNVGEWQSFIGYVPQEVTLYDDSVARNIVFGVADIDDERLRRVATIANIHEFIVSELPEGYETNVGERGVRLSGGQRQRLGLARALYHNPTILVLDEATSALDGITEDSIMNAIRDATKDITLVTIAHRLNTVKDCDLIYLMADGEIVNSGTYEDLLESSSIFRGMAKISD